MVDQFDPLLKRQYVDLKRSPKPPKRPKSKNRRPAAGTPKPKGVPIVGGGGCG